MKKENMGGRGEILIHSATPPSEFCNNKPELLSVSTLSIPKINIENKRPRKIMGYTNVLIFSPLTKNPIMKLMSAFVALIFLLNVVCPPAYAWRPGNFGDTSTAEAFWGGAFSGLITSLACYINPIAGALGSVASDATSAYLYYNDYRNYNDPWLTIEIFGWKHKFTKGEILPMLASIGVSAGVNFIQGAIEKAAEKATEKVVEGAVEAGTEAAANAAATAASSVGASTVSGVVSSAATSSFFSKLLNTIMNAIKRFWHAVKHTFSLKKFAEEVASKVKGVGKTVATAVSKPATGIFGKITNYFKNLAAKTAKSPYFRYGQMGLIKGLPRFFLQLAADITRALGKMIMKEYVKDKLEDAGLNRTVAEIGATEFMKEIGDKFIDGVVLSLYAAPFGFTVTEEGGFADKDQAQRAKARDQAGGKGTEREYIVDVYDKDGKFVRTQKMVLSVKDLSEAQAAFLEGEDRAIPMSEFQEGQEGLQASVIGLRIVEGEGTEQETTILVDTSAVKGEVLKQIGDYKAAEQAAQGIYLWRDVNGNPISQSNPIMAGVQAVRNQGLGSILGSAIKVWVLHLLSYTNLAGDVSKALKFAVAQAIGNIASSAVDNWDAVSKWYAGNPKEGNPFRTRGEGESYKDNLIKTVGREVASGTDRVLWAAFADHYNLDGAAGELAHVAVSGVVSGGIDLLRRDPGKAEKPIYIYTEDGQIKETKMSEIAKKCADGYVADSVDMDGKSYLVLYPDGEKLEAEGDFVEQKTEANKDGAPRLVDGQTLHFEQVKQALGDNLKIIYDGNAKTFFAVGKDSQGELQVYRLKPSEEYQLAEKMTAEAVTQLNDPHYNNSHNVGLGQFVAAVGEDINNNINLAVYRAASPNPDVPSGSPRNTVIEAVQAKQDELTAIIQAGMQGANPSQVLGNIGASYLASQANQNFIQSMASAMTNPLLPADQRSYASFRPSKEYTATQIDRIMKEKIQLFEVVTQAEAKGKLGELNGLIKERDGLLRGISGGRDSNTGFLRYRFAKLTAEKTRLQAEKQAILDGRPESVLSPEEQKDLGLVNARLNEVQAQETQASSELLQSPIDPATVHVDANTIQRLEQLDSNIYTQFTSLDEGLQRAIVAVAVTEQNAAAAMSHASGIIQGKLAELDRQEAALKELGARVVSGQGPAFDDIGTSRIPLAKNTPEQKLAYISNRLAEIESQRQDLQTSLGVVPGQNAIGGTKDEMAQAIAVNLPKKTVQAIQTGVAALDSYIEDWQAMSQAHGMKNVPLLGALAIAGTAKERFGSVNAADFVTGGIEDYTVKRTFSESALISPEAIAGARAFIDANTQSAEEIQGIKEKIAELNRKKAAILSGEPASAQTTDSLVKIDSEIESLQTELVVPKNPVPREMVATSNAAFDLALSNPQGTSSGVVSSYSPSISGIAQATETYGNDVLADFERDYAPLTGELGSMLQHGGSVVDISSFSPEMKKGYYDIMAKMEEIEESTGTKEEKEARTDELRGRKRGDLAVALGLNEENKEAVLANIDTVLTVSASANNIVQSRKTSPHLLQFTWIPGDTHKKSDVETVLREFKEGRTIYSPEYTLLQHTERDQWGRPIQTEYYDQQYKYNSETEKVEWQNVKTDRTTDYHYNAFGVALVEDRDYSKVSFPQEMKTETAKVTTEPARPATTEIVPGTEVQYEPKVIRPAQKERTVTEERKVLRPQVNPEVSTTARDQIGAMGEARIPKPRNNAEKRQLLVSLGAQGADRGATSGTVVDGNGLMIGEWRETGDEIIINSKMPARTYGPNGEITEHFSGRDVVHRPSSATSSTATSRFSGLDVVHRPSSATSSTATSRLPIELVYDTVTETRTIPATPAVTRRVKVKDAVPAETRTILPAQEAKTEDVITNEPKYVVGPNITDDMNLYSTGAGHSPWAGPSSKVVAREINSGLGRDYRANYALPPNPPVYSKFDAAITQLCEMIVSDNIDPQRERQLRKDLHDVGLSEAMIQTGIDRFKESYGKRKDILETLTTFHAQHQDLKPDQLMDSTELKGQIESFLKEFGITREALIGDYGDFIAARNTGGETGQPATGAAQDSSRALVTQAASNAFKTDEVRAVLESRSQQTQQLLESDMAQVQEVQFYKNEQMPGDKGKTYSMPTWAAKTGYNYDGASRFDRVAGFTYDKGTVTTVIDSAKKKAEDRGNTQYKDFLDGAGVYRVEGTDIHLVTEGPADTNLNAIYKYRTKIHAPQAGDIEPLQDLGTEPLIPFSDRVRGHIKIAPVNPGTISLPQNTERTDMQSNNVPLSTPAAETQKPMSTPAMEPRVQPQNNQSLPSIGEEAETERQVKRYKELTDQEKEIFKGFKLQPDDLVISPPIEVTAPRLKLESLSEDNIQPVSSIPVENIKEVEKPAETIPAAQIKPQKINPETIKPQAPKPTVPSLPIILPVGPMAGAEPTTEPSTWDRIRNLYSDDSSAGDNNTPAGNLFDIGSSPSIFVGRPAPQAKPAPAPSGTAESRRDTSVSRRLNEAERDRALQGVVDSTSSGQVEHSRSSKQTSVDLRGIDSNRSGRQIFPMSRNVVINVDGELAYVAVRVKIKEGYNLENNMAMDIAFGDADYGDVYRYSDGRRLGSFQELKDKVSWHPFVTDVENVKPSKTLAKMLEDGQFNINYLYGQDTVHRGALHGDFRLSDEVIAELKAQGETGTDRSFTINYNGKPVNVNIHIALTFEDWLKHQRDPQGSYRTDWSHADSHGRFGFGPQGDFDACPGGACPNGYTNTIPREYFFGGNNSNTSGSSPTKIFNVTTTTSDGRKISNQNDSFHNLGTFNKPDLFTVKVNPDSSVTVTANQGGKQRWSNIPESEGYQLLTMAACSSRDFWGFFGNSPKQIDGIVTENIGYGGNQFFRIYAGLLSGASLGQIEQQLNSSNRPALNAVEVPLRWDLVSNYTNNTGKK